MLTISDRLPQRHCQGLSRRDFLRVGSLGLAGLTLPDLLRARAAESSLQDKAVVLLFLQGGPTQIETFDPKMPPRSKSAASPARCRPGCPASPSAAPSPAGEEGGSARRRPLLRVGQRRSSELRQRRRRQRRLRAPMGPLYARVAGANHPRTGIPTNVIVPAEAACRIRVAVQLRDAVAAEARAASREARRQLQLLRPAGGGELRQNLELRCLPPERLTDRRDLFDSSMDFRRQADRTPRLSTTPVDLRAAGLSTCHRAASPGVRSVQRGSPLARPATTPARFSSPKTMQLGRHAPLHEPARQADAAGPPAVRGGLRLRHRLGLRLGHARQRQQPRQPGRHAGVARPGRPRRVAPSSRTSTPAA